MPSCLIDAEEKSAILDRIQLGLQGYIQGARMNIANKKNYIGAFACIQAGIHKYNSASDEFKAIFNDSSLGTKVAELGASVEDLLQLKKQIEDNHEEVRAACVGTLRGLLNDGRIEHTNAALPRDAKSAVDAVPEASDYEKAYNDLNALLYFSPKNKEANQRITALLSKVKSLKETESEDTLTMILSRTVDYLRNPSQLAISYRNYADNVQGSPSLGLKIAGGLMIALGFAMLVGCAIYLTPLALGVGAVGAVSILSGAGFFGKGSLRTGVSAAMCEVDDEVRMGNYIL